MLLLPLLLPVALAADPTATLSWKGEVGRLQVDAPQGEHLAPDAAARLDLRQGDQAWTWEGDSPALAGLALPLAAGEIEGALALSICTDAGNLCRRVDLAFHQDLAGRKGTAVLDLQTAAPTPAGPHDPARDFVADPNAAVTAALARADAAGGRVLLDFGAVWCPPCNALSVELLHDPADAALLAGTELLAIDADRPDAWTLKDRYAITGYPTLVMVDAAGTELRRMIGYPGEALAAAWLQADAGAGTDPAADLARAELLAVAGDLEGARPLLTAAASDPALAERPALRRARFLVSPNAEDLRWLLAHDLDAVADWLWTATELVDGDAALAAELHQGLSRRLPRASAVQAADLLAVLAKAEADPDRARLLRAAAASALKSSLSGDRDLDRSKLLGLGELLAQAGDVEGMVALMEAAEADWPQDPTFPLAQCRYLREAGQSARAEAPARRALALSWGDIRLRAAERLAGILGELGRTDEALAVIDEALAQAPAPAEGLEVRTTRYLDALKKLRGELSP